MSQLHFSQAYNGSVAEQYERYFVPLISGPLAAELVETAGLHTGQRVLDVACGTGIVARLAAAQVGPAGRVVGIDANPGMLAVARAVTPSGASIEWYEMDAAAIALPDDAFDVVLSQLALMFFPDKVAALREMRRVLAPGGRLAINVPGPIAPAFDRFAESLGRYINPDAARFARHVFSLHDPAEVQRLIEEAGFGEFDVRSSARPFRLSAPEEFIWQYISGTPLASVVMRVDDERRAALEREVVAAWQPFVKDGVIQYPQEMIVATAWK